MVIIGPMSDDEKAKPIDDLKEGLGLLFRAAKGAVDKLPTEKVEGVAKEAAKEVGRAFETIGGEIDKAFKKATSEPPPPPDASASEAKKDEKKDEPQEQPYDDAYAPEPPPAPKGPRIG
jgi:hypothetical protein